MKFLSPHWLWALVVLPAYYVWILLDETLRSRRFAKFADSSLWERLAPEYDPGARRRKGLLWVAAMAFGFIAMARPQWGMHEEIARTSGLDVMFALDDSNSMYVEDVIPSRLQMAKHLIRSLVSHLEGDRVGMVSFAASGYLACPLTTDSDYLLDVVQMQDPSVIKTQGTDISLGLETALRALDRGAMNAPAGASSAAVPSRAVILISDGEDQEGGAVSEAAKLRDDGIKLYVLGVGTEKGGPIPMRDETGNLMGYKKDREGHPVVSSFHPDDLIKIAAAGGGRYWTASPGEEELDELLKEVGALHRGEFTEHRYMVFEDRFQIPLAIAVILLLLEMTLRSHRRRKGAGALAVSLLIALGAGVLAARTASAEPLDAYLENRKGIESYEKGDVEEAKRHFGSAQALEPSSPELLYNQGLVELQQGDMDQAIQSFQEAGREAMQRGDGTLLGKSYFNMGAALAKKGDLKDAIQSYLTAIRSAQVTKNGRLEDDARKNLELLAQQPPQKKQQPDQRQQKQDPRQQQQQQKSQNDKESGSDQQKDQGKDRQGGEQGQAQPKRYADETQQKTFKSQKLTGDDAERVMEELKSRDSELQKRMKLNKDRYGNRVDDNVTSNFKDW